MPPILIVDDEKNYRILLEKLLTDAGYKVLSAENPFAALDLLAKQEVELILSDMRMPNLDGLAFYQQVRKDYGEIPFILLTAFATVETALKAMKSGVFDYIIKPFQNEELLLVVEKALAYSRLKTENILMRRQLEVSPGQKIIGNSPAIKKLLLDLNQVAPAPTSVLITGESGTGKELVARALHQQSPRSRNAMIAINCAAFAENLLESEIFGHERGSFTGAVERKRGLLEMADGGTLFLDEIGEMPMSLQPKLLRLLQEKTFRRVGGNTELECDVRIVAATNRELNGMIAAGQFREDLYYRLNVVSLHVPPLRERAEDIGLLAHYFLEKHARRLGRTISGFAEETMHVLKSYHWPGNIRELENIIERGVLFCRGDLLSIESLPDFLKEAKTISPNLLYPELGKPLPELLQEVEISLVRQAMTQAQGVQARAAKLLGISRSNLQHKLKKYGLMTNP